MVVPTKTIKKFSIPVIGFGTGKLVGPNSWNFQRFNKKQHNKTISYIHKNIKNNKISHIDTAPNYSGGLSEYIVGEALINIDRQKVFVTSKVGMDYLSRKEVEKSVFRSLKRMKIKYLDLCLIHWPNKKIPITETINSLLDLKKQGLVKNIGVSNFDIPLLMQVQKISGNQIVANQIRYNILYRQTAPIVKYCQDNGIAVIAYRPFEGGYLYLNKLWSLNLVKNITKLALDWLLNQKNVVVIAKSRDNNHLEAQFKKRSNIKLFHLFVINVLLPLEIKMRNLQYEYTNWNLYSQTKTIGK